MSIPQTMKAITINNSGSDDQVEAVLDTRPLPKLRPGYLLAKVMAVALNPSDVVLIDLKIAVPGSLTGADYAGVVVEVGPGVQRDFKPGDRVCGATRNGDPRQPENGVFAEYVVVKADIQLKIPASMGFEQAASLGVTTLTTGRCFSDKFGVAYPVIEEDGSVDTKSRAPQQILIYGGSTAMGTMVIQFAKLSNFTVLTTSAPNNMEMVRSYGADFVVDHYSSNAVAELVAMSKEKETALGPLKLCVDNISTNNSAEFCAGVLTPGGEQHPSEIIHSVLSPFTPPLPGIKTVPTIGYSFLGEEWEFMGQAYPASVEDFEHARDFAIVAEKLLELGYLRPHPVDVRSGGLEGVLSSGFSELRGGKVSGKKLVYLL